MVETGIEVKRQIARNKIAHALRDYRQTKNAQRLVDVRTTARTAGLPVPTVVERWLDEAFQDFTYYQAPIELTLGLKRKPKGEESPEPDFFNRKRDRTLFGVMYSIENLTAALTIKTFTQRECADIAVAYLKASRVIQKSKGRQVFEKIGVGALDDKFSEWKTEPPVNYPALMRKHVLNDFTPNEWEQEFKNGFATVCLNSIEHYSECLGNHPPKNHSAKEELLGRLATAKAALEKISVS